ncbi:MAG: hypothetical protein C0448_06445 [Sphingobacteriaceae bacterium]|nr:hypothetical protein [Sphingobacteriaceae bacterium]
MLPFLNISVIELDFHHDSLDGILKIFQNTEHRINVFTTSKNIKLLKDISYSNNITFNEYTGGGKYFFLRKHKEVLNSSNVIFVNTVANDFGAYLAIDKNNVIVLRIHNVNKQFQPLKSIFMPKTWFFAWKSFSYVLRQIIGKGFLWFRPILNKRISYFTFPDSSITNFVKQKHFIDDSKIIDPIPLKIFIENDTAFAEYQDVLNVTIIGAIDHRRRQYEQTIEALTSLFKIQNPPAIHLTILGKCTSAYGSEVVGKLKSITHPKFKLTTFDKQVPETEFVNCIKETHLIISPITENATTDIFKEVYGKTKTTGSILDFLKFGKVTLVPNHYTPPSELLDYVIKYNDSKHLEAVILDLIKDNKINRLNQKSLQYVRENYSQESVLKKTLSIFTPIIKHEQNPK